MENVSSCLICRGAKSLEAFTTTDHTVSKEDFTIRECSSCGFRFTSPRPDPDQIGAFYLSDAYISHAEKASGLKDRVYHAIRRRTIREKQRLIAAHQNGKRALDVGCGTGDFLAYLGSQGYSVQGIEISPSARKLAQQKGLHVQAELRHLPAGQVFDVITLWHVLEHVADPRVTLTTLHQHLAHGGHLVIAVPDHESWDAGYYRANWAAWDVPRHLFHFRRSDLKRLLIESGFEMVAIRKMWFDAPYVAMLSEQHQGHGKAISFLQGALVGLWSNLVAWLSTKPTSSSLFLAKKPARPH